MPEQTPPVEGEVVNPPASKKEKNDKGVLTQKDKRDLNLQVRTQETRVMNPVEYEQTRLVARDLIATQAVPACFANEAQVMMALRHGFELAMSPVQSLQSLYIVKGALKLWGAAVPRQLRLNGWAFEYSDESDQSCTVKVWTKRYPEDHPDYEEYTDTFTFAEAEASGYTKDGNGHLKVGWKLGMNRKKKLRYGALGLIVSTYIPDALGAATGIVEDDMNWQASIESGPDAKEARKEKIRQAAAVSSEHDKANFTPTAVQNATEKPNDQPTE